VTLSDAPIEDAVSEQFFAEFTNWYGSSYACRVCGSQLFKSVFPKGGEFEILTDDRAHPHIAIKRVFSCARCQRFVTSGASEDDVRQISVHEMPEGRIAVGGHLREPNNFEYECGSPSEYRALVSTTDAAGSTLGRDGAGFVDVGGQATSLGNDDNESLDTDRLWNLGVEACDAGNLADARSWFSRAAELGDADSMKQLAVLAAQAGDRVTALDWLRDAADHGDAESLHQLGNVAYGEGDLVVARNCYWRAAHLGYAAAMNDFGWLADKDGDRATAVAWYERAAERGDTASMYALGGLAIARGDRTAALTWLERAAELGEPHAIRALQDLRASAPHGTVPRSTANDIAGSTSARRAPGSSTNSATTGKQKGGCYVATAVYGSYDCPEVWVLRRWRDNRLASSSSGRRFIRLYYRFSPTVVRVVGNERWFAYAVRRPLDRFVARLLAAGYSSLPYSDEESSS
jgi:tetratricopeptide (TPR) repeat protein